MIDLCTNIKLVRNSPLVTIMLTLYVIVVSGVRWVDTFWALADHDIVIIIFNNWIVALFCNDFKSNVNKKMTGTKSHKIKRLIFQIPVESLSQNHQEKYTSLTAAEDKITSRPLGTGSETVFASTSLPMAVVVDDSNG